MTSRLPTLFVSHGAPSILYEPGPARDFLASLGARIPHPQAILSISAHWTTSRTMLTASPAPSLIYDFGGFADELYSIRYDAPGEPVLANRIASILKAHGIDAGRDNSRGFDHGTWVPLRLIYPKAEIPVVQLSVQPQLPPAHHLAIGEALRPLRDEGVLILASGSATHNLRDFFGRAIDSEPPAYAADFDDWLQQAVEADDRDGLLDYRQTAPYAEANHPTPEHFLPLFVALGAGDRGRTLHRSFTFGVISMASYLWG